MKSRNCSTKETAGMRGAVLLFLAAAAPIAPALAQTAAPASTPDKAAPVAEKRAYVNSVDPTGDLIRGKEYTGPKLPAPRGSDGKPELTGFWKPLREPGKPGGNIGKDLPNFELPFTEAGKKAQEYNRTKTIDPEALCILGGIPRHNASGLPFEILHTPKRLAFLYLYNTHRFVPVDGRAHEDDPDPKYFGNPVGSWDGDTLIIDSIGFKDSKDGKIWIDENGDPQSDETHVVERWSRPDFHHIHLESTITDPKYYTKPFTFSRTWVLGEPGQGLNEYACNENNIDAAHLGPGPGPIGPDGNRGGGYEKLKLPDVPPGPEFYRKQKKSQ